MTPRIGKAATIAIGFALFYFLLLEAILLWPLDTLDDVRALPPSETIALAGGVLTAAGLSALWLQLVSAAQTARESARLETERAAAAALRFDELHMEFNSAELRLMRDLGWNYLKFLTKKKTTLRAFALWWARSDARPPEVPDDFLRSAGLEHLGVKRVSDYVWALSVMVAFFVRIENRLQAHYGNQPIEVAALRSSIGPFFWTYWEPDLITLVRACDAASQPKSAAGNPYEAPYFVPAMINLSARFDAARTAKVAITS